MELKENFIYYSGNFEGIFRKKNSRHHDSFIFSEIKWQYITITELEKVADFNPERNKVGDYWYSEKLRQRKWYLPSWIGESSDIFIPINESSAFTGDLYQVLIKNLEVNSSNKLILIQKISQELFLVRGRIYFGLPHPPTFIPPSSLDVKVLSEKQAESKSITRIPGVTILGDVISSTENDISSVANPVEHNGCWGNFLNANKKSSLFKTTAQSSGKQFGCFSILSSLFFASLWGLTLMYLWFSLPKFFWPLLIIGLFWVVLRRFNWRVWAIRLGWLLIFVVIYFWVNNYKTIKSDLLPKQTKEGNIKIDPPKETKNAANVKDYASTKQIKWWDFSDRNYLLYFSTSAIKFFDSKANREKAKNYIEQDQIDFFTSVYSSMTKYDSSGLDSVVSLLNKQAELKQLNPIQKAEMVITFIQEIPYVLVHDMSCSEAQKSDPNGFITEYHREGKPCLANIIAGVQSPYEFLHNLKGDCDTRTVLGYSLLTKMNIPASIWVSEAYGHSVLGVGLPVGTGSYKDIKGMKHYAVELTAKGYRLGMISASNRNMNNWDITLYKNN